MRSRYYSVVAVQGLWLLLPLLVAAVVVVYWKGWLASLPVWIAAAVAAFLFRDPDRQIPAKPLGVVSPADGRIISAEKRHDPYLDREACCVTVDIPLSGCYVVRAPMEGKLQKQWYAEPPGGGESMRFLVSSWLQSDEGDDVVLVVKPRLPWLRLRTHISPGERTGQGMRFCYVPLGGRVEVWMPATTHIELHRGVRVHSGSDIIAMLDHGT